MKNIYYNTLKISKIIAFVFVVSAFSYTFAQDGETLFNQNCASCHHPVSNGTGPGLKGAFDKWKKAGDDIYAWVKNPQAQYDAGVPSALAIQYNVGGMNGQAVSNEEIDAIFEYIDAWMPPTPSVGGADVAAVGGAEKSNSNWLWFLIVGLLMLVVLVAIWGTRRRLAYANAEKEGEEVKEETLESEVKGWMWRNLKLVSILGFILTCVVVGWLCSILYQVGVYENYIPEQPIAFTHKVHAGDNEIDCQYCHNSASKSKHAGIPTVNVCMNCHKAIKKASSGDRGTAEIAKIHKAAGYELVDPDKDKYEYTGKTEPIKWVKAHNLPDHVYFSHAQHVSVGKIECENCHGPVKTYTVGRTSSNEMINEMELTGDDADKKIIKLERDLLTMGWCIECHNKADVQTKDNGYYDDIHERLKKDKELYKSVMEDGKVKVKEFGGWECAKCHY